MGSFIINLYARGKHRHNRINSESSNFRYKKMILFYCIFSLDKNMLELLTCVSNNTSQRWKKILQPLQWEEEMLELALTFLHLVSAAREGVQQDDVPAGGEEALHPAEAPQETSGLDAWRSVCEAHPLVGHRKGSQLHSFVLSIHLHIRECSLTLHCMEMPVIYISSWFNIISYYRCIPDVHVCI